MAELGWKFPKLDRGPKQGINDGGVSTFTGSKMYDSLAREICQNSLDAKKDGEKTVRVEFKQKTVRICDYQILSDLVRVFDDVKDYTSGSNDSKLESFLKEADHTLSSEYIELLVASDYNTKGLEGSENAEDDTPWLALTHSNGISVKGKGSQGAHGIGKNAPFACSSLRTVFYNSYSVDDGKKAFTGVTKLVTHKDDENELTIGTGYYENLETRMPVFEEDACEFRDLFSRTETGTDVIIAGFKKSDTWKEDIEKAIIRNYFVSIAKDLLVVEIEDVVLNSMTIRERIDYYLNQKDSDKDNNVELAAEFYDTYMNPTEKIVGKIAEQNDVELYVRIDDSYSKMIAEMRATCMLVKARKQNRFARYAAVVIVKDGILNDMLKMVEPAAHDEWDPEIEEDKSKQATIRRLKNKLYSWVRDTLDEVCKGEETDEYNLEGISAYLGFDDDDIDLAGDEGKESSIFDSISLLGDNVRRRKQNVTRKKELTAVKTKGIRNESYVSGNKSSGGTTTGAAGIEDLNGQDNVTVHKEGGKVIHQPVRVREQRVVMMPQNGLYRATFVLENDSDTVTISFKAVTDDGKNDDLLIRSYRINNKEYEVNNETAVLKNIKGNEVNNIFISLQYQERMALIMTIV